MQKKHEKILLAVCSLSALLSAGTPAAPAPNPLQPTPRLGINLAGPSDYATELPFVDVFRTARPWISQREGAGWGKGPELALDELGWVKKLEQGCFAEAMLCTISGGHYPGGTYTVLYEGEGKLDFGRNAKAKETKPGRILVEVDSSRGGFSLQLKETHPANYVRNIHVIMPGFERTWEKDPFHPAFLKRFIPMLLVAVAIYSLLRPQLGAEDIHPRMPRVWVDVVFGSLLGFYDGFFGPGTGTFWAMAFMLGAGFNMTRATGYTKVMNFASNLSSLLCFLPGGHVVPWAGVTMGIGQWLGAWLGSRTVVKHGARFIKPIFIAVVLGLTLKLLYEGYLK